MAGELCVEVEDCWVVRGLVDAAFEVRESAVSPPRGLLARCAVDGGRRRAQEAGRGHRSAPSLSEKSCAGEERAFAWGWQL